MKAVILFYTVLALTVWALPSLGSEFDAKNEHADVLVDNHSHILKRQSPPASNDSDPQTSLTLHPSVIARGFATNAPPSEDGQVSSLTSTNNFINFCLPTLLDYPITDGKQIRTGSCNPAPMGYIPSTDNMPSVKFMYPRNNDVIDESTTFTIQLKTKNLETGNFVNPMAHYYSAPQQLTGSGIIIGHSHVVIELLTGMDQAEPTNPNVFAFFKGVNAKADADGVLSTDVANGLPPGVYRLASVAAAANHQACLGPVAQRGTFDDAVYFTVRPVR